MVTERVTSRQPNMGIVDCGLVKQNFSKTKF